MEKSDKLYRFISKSQHILIVSLLGKKHKVKFSAPYNGISRYSTSNEVLVAQIRKSMPYKCGLITEEPPIMHVTPQAEKKEPEKKVNEPKATPIWLNKSVKVNRQVDKLTSKRVDETAKLATKVTSTEQTAADTDANVNNNVNVNNTPADAEGTTAAGTTAGPTEQVMFGIKLEEVETYMEAKEYVRDVLGVDVSRKEEVKAYCQENGIVFPNFAFD